VVDATAETAACVTSAVSPNVMELEVAAARADMAAMGMKALAASGSGAWELATAGYAPTDVAASADTAISQGTVAIGAAMAAEVISV
jgi:hypothetical protein